MSTLHDNLEELNKSFRELWCRNKKKIVFVGLLGAAFAIYWEFMK